MTRLEKELTNLVDAFLYPSRYSSAFKANTGSSVYPPYNIIKVSDSETVIELALAGFKEEEITVTLDNQTLKIAGKKNSTEIDNYLYKGIGTRYFEKLFTLTNHSRVEKAEYVDGILSVYVSFELPEEKKPKQIEISRGGSRQYLTEGTDIVGN